jgi:hypothetical protein
MEALVNSLNHDSNLTMVGQLVATGQLINILKTRLDQVAYLRIHPDVAEEPIIRPVFIAGLPRKVPIEPYRTCDYLLTASSPSSRYRHGQSAHTLCFGESEFDTRAYALCKPFVALQL